MNVCQTLFPNFTWLQTFKSILSSSRSFSHDNIHNYDHFPVTQKVNIWADKRGPSSDKICPRPACGGRCWRACGQGGVLKNLNNLILIIDMETMQINEMRCGNKPVQANGRLTRHACACSNVAMVAMQIMCLIRAN